MPQQFYLARVEGHRGRGPAVSRKHFGHPRRKPGITVEAAFEFNQNGATSVDEIAELPERHHAIGAAEK